MPVYEYYCRKCEKPFTATMHVAEHEAEVPECPTCGRKEEVERWMSSFTAKTSRKSTSY